MPTYKIRGIDVDFPYEAYDCQLDYMEKVIQSLQNKCNALLESPTGTGKTLCLLCATLAWRKSLGGFSTGTNQRNRIDAPFSQSQSKSLPTILYTSRTHSQLRQVVQELKRSSYRPKMVVLGSREQLCIHEEVRLLRGKVQTNACHNLSRKNRKRHCNYFLRAGDYLKENPSLGDEPVDIEELVNIGRSCGACPYYMSRELHKAVDIMFAPYNYLIDRMYRKSLSIDWENSILIFDEAHNLESICADAASFDLASGLLTACISEAQNCIDVSVTRREKSDDKSRNPDDFAILRGMLNYWSDADTTLIMHNIAALLLKLEKRIAEIPIKSKELGFTESGLYIYELLADLNITHKTVPKLIDTIEDGALLLEEESAQKASKSSSKLEIMSEILRIIFKGSGNSHAKYYRVHVQEVEANATDISRGKSKTSRMLSWWCFNPGIALEEFSKRGVGSIILTSGTLSPLDSFAQELKLEFPVRLENPHVISSDQIWAGVVPVGPLGCSLNSSYGKRDSLEYKQDLGNAIVNFARIVPDGLLVFFPSYYLMDQCIGCWKNMSNANSADSKTIWERICMHKQPVIEPRQSSLFPVAIEDFMTKLKETSTSGAVFFAVCRGKVSEGLDFADHAGRAVIVTGMPFATHTDPKVRLKRAYLDQEAFLLREKLKPLTGEDWYNQQASRAVNQAVGRVIRHRHDYGAIIFCDERFAHPSRMSQISLWIQPHLKCYSKFGDVVYKLTRFFRDKGTLDSAKLQSIKSENNVAANSKFSYMANEREMKIAPSLDTSNTKSFGTTMGTSVEQKEPAKSFSSLLRVKEENVPNDLRQVPPANHSNIASYKESYGSTLVCSSDLFGSNKRKLILGKGIVQHQNAEIIDLTADSSIKGSANQEVLLPCPMKKRKILSSVKDRVPQLKNSHELVFASIGAQSNESSSNSVSINHERGQISDFVSQKNVQDKLARVPKITESAERQSVEFSNQDNRHAQKSPVSCSEAETKGSLFLTEVKQKLSAAEYKEFVGFMKALKSKAMKINDVLQSITALFSGPERRPLLKRFKDYIPAKYYSLYDQYLGTNFETVDS